MARRNAESLSLVYVPPFAGLGWLLILHLSLFFPHSQCEPTPSKCFWLLKLFMLLFKAVSFLGTVSFAQDAYFVLLK